MTIKYKKDILNIFSLREIGLGRILSESKSQYKSSHPEDHVLFNANIFTLEDGKIWYGDINLTQEYNILQIIAEKLDKDIYILSELDGRFENEFLPKEKIIRNSICKIKK